MIQNMQPDLDLNQYLSQGQRDFYPFQQNDKQVQEFPVNQIPPVSLSETKPGMYSLQNFNKEDRSYMSNFDRIMSATIPAGFDVKRNSID